MIDLQKVLCSSGDNNVNKLFLFEEIILCVCVCVSKNKLMTLQEIKVPCPMKWIVGTGSLCYLLSELCL